MSSLSNTDSARVTFFGFLAKGQFFAGPLGSRLVFQILSVSVVLSFVTSVIQLSAGYLHDRQGLASIATSTEQSLGSAFSEALWEYNFELTKALLQGVFNKEHVEHVVLKTPHGRKWELGRAQADHEISVVEFSHKDQGANATSVGTLSIGISNKHVVNRLWEQASVVIVTNFLKACLASFAISVLFEWNVGRHLHKIARHVSHSNWQDSEISIELDRTRRHREEDIDSVLRAIDGARLRAQKDFARLEGEVERRKAAEQVLKLRQNELEQAYKEQSEFSYAISHDMKSPTNTIKLLISELREFLTDNFNEDVQEIVNDMDLTATRMSSLISDILHYASSAEDTPEVVPVHLDRLVSETVADLQGDIKASGAMIKINPLPILVGNPAQLRILFQNLISNAVKFRSPERQPVVCIKGEQSGGETSIEVQDNGIGIASEHFDRVFGMFKRLHTHSEYEGTGLGLTLCKRIVLNHNGKIEILSTPGKGTTFRITFKEIMKT